nr:D430 [uncultured bacterium]
MEEILSSIRRIISDEDQPGGIGAGVSTAASPAKADPVPAGAAPEQFDEAVMEAEEALDLESEDVLELTQIVNEDGTVTDIDALMQEPEPEPVFERETPVAATPPAARQRAEPAPPPAAIMDEATANMAAAALNQLVVEMPKYIGVGQGLTLEEITKELLRPMLKQWLDAHLPGTVERLVREEIARVSRLHN